MNQFRVVEHYGNMITRPYQETGLVLGEYWRVNGVVFNHDPTPEEIEMAYQEAPMTIEQKYEHAINIIKSLVDAYGCKTPKWEEARNLLDIERPLVLPEEKT